jgi:hypothetical protein
MLHRAPAWALAAVLTLPCGPSRAQVPPDGAPRATPASDRRPPARDILDITAQQAFAARIARAVAPLRRAIPDPPGVTIPGGRAVGGVAWLVGTGRAVTSWRLVDGWPIGDGDRVEIKVDGRWLAAGPGLFDRQQGWAVLDVPELVEPELEGPEPVGVRGRAARAARARAAAEAATPRHSFGVAVSPAGGIEVAPAIRDGDILFGPLVDGAMVRLRVSGRGADGRRYYHVGLGGALPPGTPVFDAEGRIASLVGLRSDDPGRTYLIPTVAVRRIVERRVEWAP